MARLATERGRMRKEDEEVLQRHTEDIERILEAKDVTGPLFSRFIIDDEDKAAIEMASNRKDRARMLISRLILRGPNAFNGFLECLESKGYRELVKKLRGSLETDPNDLWRNWKQAQYLDAKVDILQTRIGRLEKDIVSTEKIKEMSDKVDILATDFDVIKNTLRRLEQLYDANKETENTINLLNEKLAEKEKLLAQARQKIDELEKKVEHLEKINFELREELCRQNQRVKTLEAKANAQDATLAEQRNQLAEQEHAINKLEREAARSRDAAVEDRRKRVEFEEEHNRQMSELTEKVMKLSENQQQNPISQHTSPRNQPMQSVQHNSLQRKENIGAVSGTKIEPKNRFQPHRVYKR